MHTPRFFHRRRPQQYGLGLIELLVGLGIGLLTITVAFGTLLISRQTTGAVNDAAQLQQQAAYALHIIGQQARQAGSVHLNLAFAKDSKQPIVATDPVAFETSTDFDKQAQAVSGAAIPTADGAYQLALAYQSYTEKLKRSGSAKSQLRDCLGQRPSGNIIHSGFVLKKTAGASSGELQCAGSKGPRQPIIANVADFQVRFLEQADAATGNPTMQYRTADTVTSWPQVQAVEVCLEMEGTENLPDTGTTYVNCGRQSAQRGNRLRLVFRNTYQIRSQGLPR